MRNRSASLTLADVNGLDWGKVGGLMPAIVQDRASLQVLMLGYMDREALERTIETRRVTFMSRSKGRLWVKGETSGDFLDNASVHVDCDDDALLVLADPKGPTCHLGTASCFTEESAPGVGWIGRLEQIVADRASAPPEHSYTRRLIDEGPTRTAQKVGEEGVETALAGAVGDIEGLKGEAADLVFHLLVLLRSRGVPLAEVLDVLRERHKPKQAP